MIQSDGLPASMQAELRRIGVLPPKTAKYRGETLSNPFDDEGNDTRLDANGEPLF